MTGFLIQTTYFFYLLIDAIRSSDSDVLELLQTLSPVSKKFHRLCRTLMFRRFSLDRRNIKKIHDYYTRDGPQQPFTSSLSYVRRLRVDTYHVSSQTHLEVLRFFTGVTHLRIYNWDFPDFDWSDLTHLFGNFGKTVTRLKLKECLLDSNVLVSLTSMFPLVDDLYVAPRFSCEGETYRIERVVQSRGVGFRGRIDVSYLTKLHNEFLDFVIKNSSAVHSISIKYCRSGGRSQKLLNRLGGGLSYVDVGISKAGGWDLVSLLPCTNLRTLHIFLNGLLSTHEENWDILGTITSPYLEQIQIHGFNLMTEEEGQSPADWKNVDDLLCGLCDRSYTGMFGVHLVADSYRWSLLAEDDRIKIEPQRFSDYLLRIWPKFSKKGCVISFSL